MASMHGLGQQDRCQLRGLPHGAFAWESRLHPRVRRVYEAIHGTSDLVSSCDNSFFACGASRKASENRNWPHVDHNKHDVSVEDAEGCPIGDWDVYQGILYIWPSTEERCSTTVVWTGSHTDVYEELMSGSVFSSKGRQGRHFAMLSSVGNTSPLMPQWCAAARRVPVPAGSLLLWSSRTMHQGWTGGPRLAQPVCWEPAARRSELVRERKLRLAALGLPSTHWASLGIPHDLVVKGRAQQPEPTVASSSCGVVLPMRPTLRPVTLAEGITSDAMWQQFAAADWERPLPAPLARLLESSIAERFRSVL